LRTTIKKLRGVFVIIFSFFLIISCEQEFTDLGSGVVSNNRFETNAELVDIVIENSPLSRIQSDNITRELGQYLLGIYNSADYEKLEASIVSQLQVNTLFQVVPDSVRTNPDVIVETTIDTVFIKLPYQVVVENNSGTLDVDLDSIIGDITKPFTLNVYETDTYFNRLNPQDPTKLNEFFSDFNYIKTGTELNAQQDFQFMPNKNDTIVVVKRRTSSGGLYQTDTVSYNIQGVNMVKVPTTIIPLDENKIKQLFLDKIGQSEFSSQDAFNDYFRGIILEATGNEGSLISFNFNNTSTAQQPSIDIFFTNTYLNASDLSPRDTIDRFYTMPLGGIRTNKFVMQDKTYPNNDEIKVQGTAGSEAKITLFDQTKLAELRGRDWLVNDAELTLYINQSADTTNVPFRLYLYKSDGDLTNPSFSQIEDSYTEASFGGIRGQLVRDENGNKEKYVFKLTDYVSELIHGDSNFNATLKLKTFNVTDAPVSEFDTIFNNYSWNPRAVTLFNHSANNGARKATFKISYSTKK
tara:strand:+ start:568857 stop:570425 length:1569 start_codon:yes stop_codon:yes gene_type:complete